MPIPTADADRILLPLRYASVDGPPGRAVGPARRDAAAPGSAASRRLRATAVLVGLASAAAVPVAGCARNAEPATFAVPRAAAAEIRMTCPPGTFIGTMTANCPQPLTRAALGR